MSLLFNNDCFNVLPKLDEKSIDLVIVDLPYQQTNLSWDVAIDLEQMWVELKRICKKKCLFIFFTTTKYGFNLIKSKPKWFRYDLVWEKSRKVGFLSANKMPLRKHEMIYVFSDNEIIEDKSKLCVDIRNYSDMILKFIDKSKKDISKEIGDVSHFFTNMNAKQFRIPTKKKYNLLIEKYKINTLDYFIEYDTLKNKYKEQLDKTESTKYNPQLTKGKPYKTSESSLTNSYYRGGEKEYKSKSVDNKGTRHPTTILKFNNPKKSVHKTQKPVDLLEWLIKSYSNEGDTILDFCMGSGSTGVACKNLKRKFIGIEMNEDIFKIAQHRLNDIN